MADVLVIKCNLLLPSSKDYRDLYGSIKGQMKEGLVILPTYCDAVVVPEDVVVKMIRPGVDTMEVEVS